MNLKLLLPAAAAMFFGSVALASAAPFLDTSLTNPPGVYFGSGNINDHFTVDRTGSIETGLSAINRFIGPVTPTGSTYFVPTGPTSVPGKTGSEWGFVFSVNLNYNGANPNASLSDISTRLTLNDVGLGTTGSFDPMIIPDNAISGAGFQNSEALSFSLIAAALGDPGYNINADDTYIFTLDVLDHAGALLSSNQMTVIAGKGATDVPEPMTLSLFAAGLVGAGVLGRRRKAIKQACSRVHCLKKTAPCGAVFFGPEGGRNEHPQQPWPDLSGQLAGHTVSSGHRAFQRAVLASYCSA